MDSKIAKRAYITWVALLLGVSSLAAQSDVVAIPKHLAIARELVDNIKSEDNQYSLGGQSIGFPGDLFSSRYSMRADCSGFLLAVFDRAKYSTQSEMVFLNSAARRRRPAAEDFVHSIETEKGFRQIKRVSEMMPGDLLAHAMLKTEDQQKTGTTGHIFLINSVPTPIEPKKPIVEGTHQFLVSVIDSNEEHVGDDDTRLVDPSNKVKGLGKGSIRVYVDANDALVGWARTFKNASRFFSYSTQFPSDSKARKAAIGRPTTGQ